MDMTLVTQFLIDETILLVEHEMKHLRVDT